MKYCGVVRLRVEDVKGHPINPNKVLVKVKVPMKGVKGGASQWLEPNMREVRVRYRLNPRDPQTWQNIINKNIRILELEREAQKIGYKIAKSRKVVK